MFESVTIRECRVIICVEWHLTAGVCGHVTELTSMETEAGVVDRDADDQQECDVIVAKETELVVKTVHANRAQTEPRQ